MLHNDRITGLLGIATPILLAPMAGPGTAELAIAVSEAGGLGGLPCAMLSLEEIEAQALRIRQRTPRPFNLNFFCHTPPKPDAAREAAWSAELARYYGELGLDPDAVSSAANRAPFAEAHCALVEKLQPAVVSFHFGLPESGLLQRVKNAGCKVLSSATTVAEARWLEDRGADAIIAQGSEAGGHRGMFLSDDISRQIGTMALVPQIADAVDVPVIASGGIADARGIVAAFALGADAVQIGTAYLFCPEAKVSPPYRSALDEAAADGTVLTNVFTGRPARGLVNRLVREAGPMSCHAPDFPRAATAIGPLRAASESTGRGDFSPLWAGQAVALSRSMGAAQLTQALASEAEALSRRLSASRTAS